MYSTFRGAFVWAFGLQLIIGIKYTEAPVPDGSCVANFNSYPVDLDVRVQSTELLPMHHIVFGTVT